MNIAQRRPFVGAFLLGQLLQLGWAWVAYQLLDQFTHISVTPRVQSVIVVFSTLLLLAVVACVGVWRRRRWGSYIAFATAALSIVASSVLLYYEHTEIVAWQQQYDAAFRLFDRGGRPSTYNYYLSRLPILAWHIVAAGLLFKSINSQSVRLQVSAESGKSLGRPTIG